MGQESGSIALGLLTGDRDDIAATQRDAFSASGLAHILAVSGLHLGFLALLLMWIFKLFKARKIVSHPIIILILLLFTLFVGSGTSVIRAFIMATVMLLSHMLFQKYDSFNALALATTIILLYGPIFLFDVGFLFSVGSLMGIIFFYRTIRRGLERIKAPRLLADQLTISLTAQIGIYPAMIFFFESVQPYSLLVNIFMHFIIAIAFVSTLLGLFLSLLFPSLIILLQFAGVFIVIISVVGAAIASLPLSLLFVYAAFGALLFLCYLLYFLTSRFFRFPDIKGDKKRGSAVAFKVVAIFTAVSFMFIGIPLSRTYESDNFVAMVSNTRDVTSIVRHDERTYIIGETRNFRELNTALLRLGMRNIDAIFLFDVCSRAATAISRLSVRHRFGAVFVCENSDISLLIEHAPLTNVFQFDGETSLTANVNPIVIENRLLAYELVTRQGSLLFSPSGNRHIHIPVSVIDRAFAVRSFVYLNAHSDRMFLTNLHETAFANYGPAAFQFSTQVHGRILFDLDTHEIFSF